MLFHPFLKLHTLFAFNIVYIYLCLDFIPLLFEFNASCPVPSCTFNGVFQPALRGQFLGFDNIIKMQVFFNLTSNFTLHQISEKAEPFCELDWATVQQRFPLVPPTDLPYACFRSAYVPRLLVNGLGFSDNTAGAIVTHQYIDGTEVVYPVGAVALFVNNMGWDTRRELLFRRYWYALPVSFALLAAAAAMIVLHFLLEWRDKRNKGYEQLRS